MGKNPEIFREMVEKFNELWKINLSRKKKNGAGGVRTRDFSIANQALVPLSYSPSKTKQAKPTFKHEVEVQFRPFPVSSEKFPLT